MIAQAEAIRWIEILAIILSVVSLIITIVGFFASLKFYREGVALQSRANNALTKLEEKTQYIQAQVGGMFERTLDAAIGKREVLSESFAELTEQLERSKSKILDESLTEIGAAGAHERKRLEDIVDRQIELLRQKVETTRESAEDVAHGYSGYSGFPENEIPEQYSEWTEKYLLSLFDGAEAGLTIADVQRLAGSYMSHNRARRILNYLIRKGLIVHRSDGTKAMKYFLKPATDVAMSVPGAVATG